VTSAFDAFARRFEEIAAPFFGEFERTRTAEPELTEKLGEKMLGWANAALGPSYEDRLIKGYCFFVIDAHREQRRYETRRRYRYDNFAEVYEKAYSNQEFMDLYHWGVYTATFVWLHHLKIYRFFEEAFLPELEPDQKGQLLDLGAGSGIWHLLALERLRDWAVTAVDVSQPSIVMSARMAATLPFTAQIEHVCDNAVRWASPKAFDAGISSFLLEHLERPIELLATLANALKPRAHAFLTCAVTAAETDHIFEFKHESEVISLLEQAGFRVKQMLSAAPATARADSRYLPRSMALVV